ncbi:hypothetical protein GCM10010329_08570 [Streptomyces spiroverticillatus]|uniref:DUF4232 domain-containing protein n=1 Tax=Streptomyces finlayi TaxID=67296 RepID=A0A918WT83_9ACTN|nr:DUF4232 domain-containing protein [Streptomyces finlayi]GGZ90214.1 hypothetical protein GCM10010329_08570 [Streptomyces spiroverticillatus]GHC81067.1 hypothetical protein GCM10010334_08560 [Streptomyces finlayi]
MSARTTRLFALTSAALIASLSLTACQNGDGTKDAGSAHASAPAAPDGKAPGDNTSTGTSSSGKSSGDTQHTPSGSTGKTTTSTTTGSGGAADPDAPAHRARCDASTIKVTAQVVDRPLNTMILTATNKGSKLCDLFYAPVVRFEGAQSVPPSMKDTQPQAVVSLRPGRSGYAAVKLSSPTGTPDPGYTAKSLSIGFYDKDQRNLDGFAPVPLPAKGVYIDNSIRVSFWQSDLNDVSSL